MVNQRYGNIASSFSRAPQGSGPLRFPCDITHLTLYRRSFFCSPLSALLSPLSPILALSLIFLTGCHDIDTAYGQREGPGAAKSVNGTAVLGEMFEKTGHRVYSWRALSPRLRDRADCIVWFPDDFRPPRERVRLWLEDWLRHGKDRTLIYVGRDFDAAPWYWEHILADATPEQKSLLQDRFETAQAVYAAERRLMPKSEDCEWFTVESSPAERKANWLERLAKKATFDLHPKPRQVKSLEGDPAWLDGVDAAKTDISLLSRITPPEDADVLLRSGEDVLVSRQQFGNGRLIVVANGSFLLNVPLVNHEHRKLAGKLIDAIGPPGKTVVFLESRASRLPTRARVGPPGFGYGKHADRDDEEPPIRENDPAASTPTGLEIFGVWPTNWILLHLAAVGVIFCFSRWPIFGRPRTPETPSRSDFGRHVDALAELLKRTRDRVYAMDRIVNYRQISEREK
jgi:hypothetical protein